ALRRSFMDIFTSISCFNKIIGGGILTDGNSNELNNVTIEQLIYFCKNLLKSNNGNSPGTT
ncbi:MAG: hypothetical protein ABI683_14920, partial [Ginsengibacter sp.]